MSAPDIYWRFGAVMLTITDISYSTGIREKVSIESSRDLEILLTTVMQSVQTALK